MSCQDGVYQWTQTVRQQLPQLSQPQATVLALWSLGMVLARSCGLSAVSLVLATGLGRKENSVRQQMREWCYDADAKRGAKRRAVDPTTCFAALLGWVLSWWEGRQIALALDATSLGERFVVLALSVVYRGCAIPVAWTILPANQKHAWRGGWCGCCIGSAVPSPAATRCWSWPTAASVRPGLYRRIRRLGWHPFLRSNLGGSFRPACGHDFRPLRSFVPTPGCRWQGQGIAFKSKAARLPCTLLACWEAGYKDPWLILTDLPPDTADAAWYGLRAWIENHQPHYPDTRLGAFRGPRCGLLSLCSPSHRSGVCPGGRWPGLPALPCLLT